MTLPPNSLASENPALTGDLLAVLAPAPVGAAGDPAAPFSEMLAGAGLTPPAAGVCAASPDAPPAVPPACVPAALLYSTNSYNTLLQPAVVDETELTAAEPAEENTSDQPPSTDSSSVAADNATLLAYEFVAGQWVQVPPPAPVKPVEEPVSEAPVCEKPALVVSRDRKNTNDSFCAQPVPVRTDDKPQPVAGEPLPPANTPATDGRARLPQNVPAATPDKNTPAAAKKTASEETPAGLSVATVATAETPAAARIEQLAPTAPHLRAPAAGRPEKIAAPGPESGSEIASGVNSSNQAPEKKTLVTDVKPVKSTSRAVGMPAANRETSMPYSAVNKSSAPAHPVLPQPVLTGGIQTSTTAPAAEISAIAAAQAPRLVQEINAIADRISSIDRNTVEVRFDFNDTDRLSVRVEYRDGTVHTTFRTDSDHLRNAIAREWTVQAAASEPRAYRVAEPTFTANNDRPISADPGQSGPGSGQSHARHFEQSSSPGLAAHFPNGRSHGSSGSADRLPAAGFRPETSRHLHTFA